MRRSRRWVLMLTAFAVALSVLVMPVGAGAAPGAMQLFDDPRVLFGDPDEPHGSSALPAQRNPLLLYLGIGLRTLNPSFNLQLVAGLRSTPDLKLRER